MGLIAILQTLQLGQVVAPLQTLVNTTFAFVPQIVGAGVIFFVGTIVAKIAGQIVETALLTANADGWAARAGIVAAPAEGSTPTAGVSKTLGTIVFAVVIILFAIAALQTLGISSISDPAVNVLQTVFAAIPRVIAASILLAIAFFIGRWVSGLIEQILPTLGFDRSVQSLGLVPATTSPSKALGAVVLTAIMVFAAIEATKLMEFAAISALLVQVIDLGGRVLFGSVIIAAGVVLANVITRLMSASTGDGGFAPTIVRYAIIALAVAMGLRFMGLANEIVNLGFGLILGSAAVACALAFGLGGRPTAHKLLERWTDDNRAPTIPVAPTPPTE